MMIEGGKNGSKSCRGLVRQLKIAILLHSFVKTEVAIAVHSMENLIVKSQLTTSVTYVAWSTPTISLTFSFHVSSSFFMICCYYPSMSGTVFYMSKNSLMTTDKKSRKSDILEG